MPEWVPLKRALGPSFGICCVGSVEVLERAGGRDLVGDPGELCGSCGNSRVQAANASSAHVLGRAMSNDVAGEGLVIATSTELHGSGL